MKLLKNETEKELTLEMILHVRSYSIVLDKTRCTGCEICMKICPREAIETKKASRADGENAKPPAVNISEEKCHYCGMCVPICPFGALTVRINKEQVIPVVNSESFPQLVREIEVDQTTCPPDCVDCEKACPLNLIKVNLCTPDGTIQDVASGSGKENLAVTVDIKKAFCPCCKLCEKKCPEGAIHVEKIFHGNLKINHEECPEGCQDCLDVCPITGVLNLSDDGKVYVNELFCVYCGVCRIVCPEEEALELNRTYIRHTPVRSGAWNKALEKLTSTKAMTKELRSKSSSRTKESVGKRFPWRMKT